MAHKRTRRFWTPDEDVLLKQLYPDTGDAMIRARLKRTRASIYNRARIFGLKKSKEYMERELLRLGKKLLASGLSHRFPKGHVPMNKGLRRPGWYAGRMRETQFKKGQFPANHDPGFYVIGALRVNTDGYIDMRTSFAPGGLGWSMLHIVLYEDKYGPVPKGHCLRFKDGDKLNIELENIELISRGENCRRNSIHHLPPLLKKTIMQLGVLKRKIREKQDRGSTQPSL